MAVDLSGKKALVTGAARGIGRGCALELARAGADVAVNDRADSPAAQETIAAIQALGRQAWLVAGNVFESSGCAAVAAAALERLGGLDILVSNPAYSRRSDFLECPPELFDRILQGTLHGGFYLSQAVARHMVARGTGGKIIFISSVQSRIPYVRSAAYNAAKAGLNHLAFTIAAELVRHRINVNVIEPGWIDTPGEHETFGTDYIAQAAPTLPWGRLGTPEDIGRAAAFLASADADYITGTSLLVDGGFWLRGAGA
ncbi:MAG: SDR family oxidoreductase [Pirellulales bacterium]